MATTTFLLDWTMVRTDFQSGKSQFIKIFLTSYQNVLFQWKARLNLKQNTLSVWLSYDNGPLPKVFARFQLSTIKAHEGAFMEEKKGGGASLNEFLRTRALGWSDYANVNELFSDLRAAEAIIFQFKLQIPVAAFQYKLEFPFVDPSPAWLFNKFENIESLSQDSDAQFVSSDDVVFYCHKFMVGNQSEAFEAMFRSPQTDDERNGIYRFPTLEKEAMRAILRYLYTGVTAIADSPTTEIVEVAHVAEQYGLEKLKQSCEAALWKRVGETEELGEFMKIMLYAEGNSEYLQQRAMDALVEKLRSESFTTLLYAHCACGPYSNTIIDKFMAFCSARVSGVLTQE